MTTKRLSELNSKLDTMTKEYQDAVNERNLIVKNIATLCTLGSKLLVPNLTVDIWLNINRIIPEFCNEEITCYFVTNGWLARLFKRREYKKALGNVQTKLSAFLQQLIFSEYNELEVAAALCRKHHKQPKLISDDTLMEVFDKLDISQKIYRDSKRKISNQRLVVGARSTIKTLDTIDYNVHCGE